MKISNIKNSNRALFASIASLLILGACASGNGSSSADVTTPPPPAEDALKDYKLVWSEEFNKDGMPDSNTWSYDTEWNKKGWHNKELQYYSDARPENSIVKDGNLIITALKEDLSQFPDWGRQKYSSARLISKGKREFLYGVFDIRAKIPCGKGTWPAIWMLGNSGDWPKQGEIDIMEHASYTPNVILGTLHMGAHFGENPIGNKISIPDACDNFHNYQIMWTPDKIDFFVDNKQFHSYSNDKKNKIDTWPFSNPQYFILNLAMGGTLGGDVKENTLPQKFYIDYIRVYQK